jgi:hypothetical protein
MSGSTTTPSRKNAPGIISHITQLMTSTKAKSEIKTDKREKQKDGKQETRFGAKQ